MSMRLLSRRCFLLVAIGLMLTDRISAQTMKIPTAEELREVYDAGQYHACLQQISRMLFLKGAPTAGVDRPKLLLLRGDCLVKLKDSRTAMKAYNEAEAAASLDPATALRARGGAIILKNCRGFTYMPPGVQPIDVTTDDGWKKAAGAIYDATWQSSQSDLLAAQTAQDIAPIVRVVPTITDLVALIQISGADSGQLAPMVKNIGERARGIISRVLAQQEAATAAVANNADIVLTVTVGPKWNNGQWVSPIRQGLTTPDRDALLKIIGAATQAYNLAVQGKEAAFLVGGNEEKWQAVVDQAANVRDHAQLVLNAE
jgi:hypothetical protein